MRKSLEDLISREGISDVEFMGFVKDPLNYIKNARIVFASGYLGILEAFSYGKPVIAVYDNELKGDYLEMMPGSRSMMWIADGSEGIASSIREAISNKSVKAARGYEFSLENGWERVKRDYYLLWGCDGGETI